MSRPPEGQADLGFLYRKGLGVAQNYIEAEKWSKKAADQGDVGAQFNLAMMYYSGECVTKNYVKAHKWINLAAIQNNDYAEFRDEFEGKMTREQIAEAQKLASEFVPKKEIK